MKKEFISYISALQLKELGFDEPCFCYYVDGKIIKNGFDLLNKDCVDNQCLAPLYQQAFSFLVKLQDEFKISLDEDGWFIYNLEDEVFLGDEALEVLINTVKNNE